MRETAARSGLSARRIAVWALPGAVTLSWLAYVLMADQWDRVAYHWRSSLTMVAGSFVAGSTPQGGGAVAFPVFTKVLEVPADVARTFSLSIQAVGMVTAALIILLAARKVDGKAILVSGLAGMAGFLGGLFVLGRPDTPFWSFRISPAYVKVTFTIALAAMAYIVWLAAIPIVVWGAPLGTYFIHVLKDKLLVAFVASMAAVEVVSTIVFLDDLRTDLLLRTYAVVGLLFAIGCVWALNRNRHRLLGLDPAHA